MAKKELTEKEIAECIPDLWMPLTPNQREFWAQNFTVQKFKKNETIYCEGESPMHLMCLLSGKVKIIKTELVVEVKLSALSRIRNILHTVPTLPKKISLQQLQLSSHVPSV